MFWYAYTFSSTLNLSIGFQDDIGIIVNHIHSSSTYGAHKVALKRVRLCGPGTNKDRFKQ